MRGHMFNENAVGMVVFLDREPQGYRLGNGVIIDWDYYCARKHIWHENIGKCDLKSHFYSIIQDDGTAIYVNEGKDFYQLLLKILNKLIEIFIIFNLEKIIGINSHRKEMHDDIIGPL